MAHAVSSWRELSLELAGGCEVEAGTNLVRAEPGRRAHLHGRQLLGIDPAGGLRPTEISEARQLARLDGGAQPCQRLQADGVEHRLAALDRLDDPEVRIGLRLELPARLVGLNR